VRLQPFEALASFRLHAAWNLVGFMSSVLARAPRARYFSHVTAELVLLFVKMDAPQSAGAARGDDVAVRGSHS
jgi:hypothetical protein